MPNILLFSKKVVPLHYQNTSRSGAVVARRAHNPKVVGSSPASATKLRDAHLLHLFFCILLFGIAKYIY